MPKAMSALCRELGISYIDLMDFMPEQGYEELFFTCDGHWSEKGNDFVAKVLQENLEFYQ